MILTNENVIYTKISQAWEYLAKKCALCLWSNLLRLTNSFMGKSVLMCSMLSYLLYILDMFHISYFTDISGLVITINGSLLFLFGSIAITAQAPTRIQLYRSSEDYIHWCLREEANISIKDEFQIIQKLSKKHPAYHSVLCQRAKELGDLSTITDRGLNRLVALRILAEAQYFIDETQKPTMRIISTALIGVGVVMMFLTPALRIIKEAWRI